MCASFIFVWQKSRIPLKAFFVFLRLDLFVQVSTVLVVPLSTAVSCILCDNNMINLPFHLVVCVDLRKVVVWMPTFGGIFSVCLVFLSLFWVHEQRDRGGERPIGRSCVTVTSRLLILLVAVHVM